MGGVQRGARKQKAAGLTGRLSELLEDGQEGDAEGLPNVMKSLCTSHVTAPSPQAPSQRGRRQAAFFNALTALRTSSTWPGTFRPRHSCLSTPSGPTRKVLRSMPLTFFPYMILFLTTPIMWHIFSSVSAINSNGSSSLVLKSS